MTGAEYIIDFLIRRGVDTVFGYPGVAVLELYDALGKSPLRHILVRHEQGAVFAASGYARTSGRIGVAVATSGPGAVNLATGIADAYLDSVPLLAITGQVESSAIGRDAFQEADIMGMTLPVTKHNYLVRDIKNLPRSLEEAYKIALSDRCGPVLIDITKDVLAADIDESIAVKPNLPRKRENEYPLSDALPQIKSALAASKRPLILAGGGVVSGGASHSLTNFARKSGIPIVTTLMGMGILVGDGVELYGMTGVYGNRAARAALDGCDLAIAVGCRFSDRTVSDFKRFERSRTIIHCDCDPAEINKNCTADIAAVCGADAFLDALSDAEIEYDRPAIEGWKSSLSPLKAKHVITEHPNRLSNWEILRAIDTLEAERRDALYVSDVGDFQMSAARELEPRFERGFITSGGLGAMGFGLPAAIGASYSRPNGVKNIVLLCGDGGFQMTMPELSTLKAAPLPIKVFIFDNSSLRMIKNAQLRDYGGATVDSALIGNPDFSMIAAAYDIKSAVLDMNDRAALSEKINALLDIEESVIIDCKV